MSANFHFKQFTIQQLHSAMKVTEVAAIFGAWLSQKLNCSRILDVGSGTGLLSFMIAQKKNECIIKGIDIHLPSVEESNINLQTLLFPHHIEFLQQDINTFSSSILFDAIICNPPFFENQLKSYSQEKKIAWHSSNFSLENLFIKSHTLLNEYGLLAILIPIYRKAEIEKLTLQYFGYFSEILHIHHNEASEAKYCCIIITKVATMLNETHIYIRNEDKSYHSSFIAMMKEFYLYL